MLLFKFYILVLTIPLASQHLSPILIRLTLLMILYSSLLFTDIEILGGLFQPTSLFQNHELLLSVFVPIMIYSNAETDKSRILLDTKGKTGIYMWVHKESGKIYIGSAVDLYIRLRNYYNFLYLKEGDNYISKALLRHTYSAFSLSILDYIDITGLSKKEARKLILEREQFYLDFLFSGDEPNTFNLLKVAGSSLGFQHTEETKALISLIHTGKILSNETLTKMSEAKTGEYNPMFGRTRENHPRGMLGKTHSAESIAKMREAKTGENRPRGMLGKTQSAEAKAKISETKGTAIFVYNSQGTLVNKFSSAKKAAMFFDSNFNTILKYARNGNIFKDKWKLSTSLISKE